MHVFPGRRRSCVQLKCCQERSISMMSYARLDITTIRIMLESWPHELYSHCAGVTRSFGP